MSQDTRFVEQLIDQLQTHDPTQANAVIETLRRIGASAVEPLLNVLRDHGSDEMRVHWAVEALGGIGLPAFEPLVAALDEDNLVVRAYATTALGLTGDRRAVEPLLHLLRADAVPAAVRLRAVEALGKLGDERAITPLIALLSGPQSFEDAYAADALVALGAPSVLPLIAVLEDGEREQRIRVYAASTLGRLRDERAIAPLINVLLDTNANSELRRVAATSLAKLDNVGACKPLLRVVMRRDDVRAVRVWAIELVGGRHARVRGFAPLRDRVQAFQPLLDVVMNTGDDGAVRAAAVEALCDLVGERAITPLIGALDDAAPEVRVGAIQALGRCGDARALAALERMRRLDVTERGGGDGAATITRKSIAAIKRRLGLPLTADDDPVAEVVARHGRFSLNLLKGMADLPADQQRYLIRLDEPPDTIDIGIISATHSDRSSILTYLGRFLEDKRRQLLANREGLRKIQDPAAVSKRRDGYARMEHRYRLVDRAIRELRAEPVDQK